MRVASIHTWRIRQGRYADFMGTLAEGQKILERVGGRVRTWVPLYGGPEPNTLTVVVEHDDIAAHGAFSKKLQADPEWLGLIARIQQDENPAADYVSSALISEPLSPQ